MNEKRGGVFVLRANVTVAQWKSVRQEVSFTHRGQSCGAKNTKVAFKNDSEFTTGSDIFSPVPFENAA